MDLLWHTLLILQINNVSLNLYGSHNYNDIYWRFLKILTGFLKTLSKDS